ncbi:Down Syndrome Cell Adhesion Molecule [Manis pentadactyla]|nr:Down Syndrome Cell Adhesion Molecule [Manis pentadactyla]
MTEKSATDALSDCPLTGFYPFSLVWQLPKATGTKHCAEAAPILTVPGSRMVEGGRDQESFQAVLTLEMRIAHVCLLNQKEISSRIYQA